jgi:hypothetical protein
MPQAAADDGKKNARDRGLSGVGLSASLAKREAPDVPPGGGVVKSETMPLAATDLAVTAA